MSDTERQKLQEDLRFQIERMLFKRTNRYSSDEIANLVKIQSFTVAMEKGTVKSVRVKIDK